MVLVTGTSASSTGTQDYATVAYDAATGAHLWLRRYSGTGGANFAVAVGVSPDGKTVFVTGTSQGNYYDYATVAYDAATGVELWEARYNGPLGFDGASSLAVSPTGNIVVVTGSTEIPDGNTTSWATVAYDPATGAPLCPNTYYAPHPPPPSPA